MTDETAQVPEGTPESTEQAIEQPVEQPTEQGQEPETIFDGVEPAVEQPAEDLVDTPENPDARPDWLPEKFKTPEDLVKAYNEMGAKIREKNEPPENYEVTLAGADDSREPLELTENDVAAFKEAGLTNEQAQKITDYFAESVMPDLIQAKADIEKQRLAQEWNMGADSNEFTQQLAKVKAWAQQNMPEAAVTELSRTANGVATLSKLMEQGAASHRAVGDSTSSRMSKQELTDLMNDERYWNGDESYRDYVRQQFAKTFD